MLCRAPGRVNLIGEHTDYNDGFVLPMAIDRSVLIAARPRADRKVRVHALDLGVWGEFSLDELRPPREGAESSWLDYLAGTAWALIEAGYPLVGWEGIMSGDVPRGSGLSSSAALELATARTFYQIGSEQAGGAAFEWDAKQMALIGQRAENDWLGVKSGIMDQLASAAGVVDHALLIDCRSLEIDPVPLPSDVQVVVLDTNTRRGLVDSQYNLRREQCEMAASAFGVAALRDVSVARFERDAHSLPELVRRRAKHVIYENDRTLRAAEVLRRGDAASFGLLMDESHVSLRDDFEVSSSALDAIVAAARAASGCLGARMTGAGFGGCAVALLAAGASLERFVDEVLGAYHEATNLSASAYPSRASAGAATITV